MSGPTEAIPPPDIIFKGTDGNECEAFVAAIRDHAFVNGRDEDLHWMLRFATARLRGKALRWHARLDPSIKSDWDLFIQALFDQYPSVEGTGEAEIGTPVWSTTTFSPAPSTVTLPMNPEANRSVAVQNISVFPSAQAGREESQDSYVSHERTSSTRQYDASSTGRQFGLLRIIDVEGTTVPQYVWWDYNRNRPCLATTTINRHEAPVVSFLPSSAPQTISGLNPAGGRKTLALSWESDPETEYYAVYHSADHETTTPGMKDSGYIAKAWNLLADGTLQATVSSFSRSLRDGRGDETKFTSTEVHINTSGDDIRFVRPGAVLEQDKPSSKVTHPFVRARIIFEPL